MRYLMSVSYNGAKFYGFQKLLGKRSIQGELEKALTKINKTLVNVKGAGRTDRGVHALDQKVHFDLNVSIPENRLVNAINSLVEPDIHVNNVKVVNDSFHARFDVVSKKYTYIINLGEFDTIYNDFVYNYNRLLNIKNMNKCKKVLIGKHSYKAFTSGDRNNYNSEIYSINIKRHHDSLYITFIGKSFYRYMVRNMVGALILAGENKINNIQMEEMLNSGENKYHFTTVPANGLYLEEIKY